MKDKLQQKQLEQLRNRTSIRMFQKEARVEPALITECLEAAKRVPTAFEAYSVIQISDPGIRESLPYDRPAAPLHFIFCLDFYRLGLVTSERIKALPTDTCLLIWGLADIFLFLSAFISLVEGHGLGTVLLGGVARRPRPYIEILKLPRGVFPVIGLVCGYPDEAPEVRPRLSSSLLFHKNEYRVQPDDIFNCYAQKARNLSNENYFGNYGQLNEKGETVFLRGAEHHDYMRHIIRKLETLVIPNEKSEFAVCIEEQLGVRWNLQEVERNGE